MPIRLERGLTQAEVKGRARLAEKKPAVAEKYELFDARVEEGKSNAIIQFQVDYRCNFRCEHCCITGLRRSRQEESFDVGKVRDLADQADEMGLAEFVITGGEPLIIPWYDELVEAIGPDRFYIASDTNGWYLDEKMAKHLVDIGVDKTQISLDSLSADEHDAFRRHKGAHERVVRGIRASLDAGLSTLVQTVVTRDRIRSSEFEGFLKFINEMGAPVFVTYAKPVGAWERNYGAMVSRADMDYMRELEEKYRVFTHLTPAYGWDLGCIAVKRMISVTQYGDVMPCPYTHISLGNVFDESLEEIVERGMKIRHFGEHRDTCLMAEDVMARPGGFVKEYIEPRVYDKVLPVPWNQVFMDEDFIK